MKVLLDRVQHRDTRIEELEAEKRRLSEALEGNCQKLKEEEEKNFNLGKDLEFAVNEVCKMKDECLELKGATEVKAKRAVQLEAELEESAAELRKKDVVLEELQKEKAEAEASTQAEVEAAYREVEEATRDYVSQVDALGPLLFKLGCKAVLKKIGFSEDHPIHQDLPTLEDQTARKSSAPPSGPLVEAPSEVPPDTPSAVIPPSNTSGAV